MEWFLVHDGHNGIMAFGTNLLGPRSVPLGNFIYKFVCTKAINRFSDHLLVVGCPCCGQIRGNQGLFLRNLQCRCSTEETF